MNGTGNTISHKVGLLVSRTNLREKRTVRPWKSVTTQPNVGHSLRLVAIELHKQDQSASDDGRIVE